MELDMQLFIYRCPAEQAYALSLVLANWELGHDWEGPPAEVGVVATAMEPYTLRPAPSLDSASVLADEIIEAAPGAWFQVWTDPDDGALGTLVQYTPKLGRYEAYCDADGQPYFSANDMLQAAKTGETAAKVLTGYAWEQTLPASAEERLIKAEAPPEHEQYHGEHSDAVAAALARDADRDRQPKRS